MDIKSMSIAQLKDMQRSIDRELRKKLSDTKADQHDQNLAAMARLQESFLKSQSQPEQTQQAIAAKSEAEITARAEALLKATSNQRVII
jgi:hypothetical protein